jgi:hypothetical protein
MVARDRFARWTLSPSSDPDACGARSARFSCPWGATHAASKMRHSRRLTYEIAPTRLTLATKRLIGWPRRTHAISRDGSRVDFVRPTQRRQAGTGHLGSFARSAAVTFRRRLRAGEQPFDSRNRMRLSTIGNRTSIAQLGRRAAYFLPAFDFPT